MISRIIYYILAFIVIVAAGFTLFGVGHFKWMYHSVQNPKADFLVSGDTYSKNTLIIFTAYPCGYCKELDPVFRELQDIRKDWRFIVRPIAFGEGEMRRLASVALAMGEEGYFEEMHRALMEYPEFEIPDEFIYETAELYGVNQTRLEELKASKKVQKYIDNNNTALQHIGAKVVPSFMVGKTIHVVDNESLPTLKDMLRIIEQSEK